MGAEQERGAGGSHGGEIIQLAPRLSLSSSYGERRDFIAHPRLIRCRDLPLSRERCPRAGTALEPAELHVVSINPPFASLQSPGGFPHANSTRCCVIALICLRVVSAQTDESQSCLIK